jgi:pyrimidine-nucleoside phosphorylase
MQVYELIRKKRDGHTLHDDEIEFFLDGYTREDIPDYQAAAMAMAIYFQGLTDHELMVWTRSMLHSGDVLDFSDIDGYKVDKHSTGGVGDKPSLILAPIVAAAGLYVPMISGRGLGHTGGTLDKLESIPGFEVQLNSERFREVLSSCGMVLAGQSQSLAPADKKLYALRDVTATVESIPLIASSIMSKKLAEGIDGLVLDVKFGNGAFMREPEQARELAQTLVSIGERMGKQTVALLTDMNQPLGTHIGNSLEVIESCEILRGRVDNDVAQLSFRLAAEMMVLGGAATDLDTALKQVDELIASGAAFRKFQEVTAAQGGDPRALEEYDRLPKAKGVMSVVAEQDGIVQSIQCGTVGLLGVQLGAGRVRVGEPIDPAVGFVINKKIGDEVQAGEPLATIYYNDKERAESVSTPLATAFSIGSEPLTSPPLVRETIGTQS